MRERRCAAKTCFNREGCPNLKFFSFPSDKETCRQWIINSGREDLLDKPIKQLSKFMLCADHFEAHWFLNPKSKTTFISSGCPIPTIFYSSLGDVIPKSLQRSFAEKNRIDVTERTGYLFNDHVYCKIPPVHDDEERIEIDEEEISEATHDTYETEEGILSYNSVNDYLPQMGEVDNSGGEMENTSIENSNSNGKLRSTEVVTGHKSATHVLDALFEEEQQQMSSNDNVLESVSVDDVSSLDIQPYSKSDFTWKKIPDQICRLCATKNELHPKQSIVRWLDFLKEIVPGMVAVDDGLPQHVCRPCRHKLYVCVKIKADIVEANEKLLRVKRAEKKLEDVHNIESNFCGNVGEEELRDINSGEMEHFLITSPEKRLETSHSDKMEYLSSVICAAGFEDYHVNEMECFFNEKNNDDDVELEDVLINNPEELRISYNSIDSHEKGLGINQISEMEQFCNNNSEKQFENDHISENEIFSNDDSKDDDDDKEDQKHLEGNTEKECVSKDKSGKKLRMGDSSNNNPPGLDESEELILEPQYKEHRVKQCEIQEVADHSDAEETVDSNIRQEFEINNSSKQDERLDYSNIGEIGMLPRENNVSDNHKMHQPESTFSSEYISYLKKNITKEKNCQFCFKKFLSINELTAHLSSHRADRFYICEFCGKKYSYKSSLLAHQKNHLSPEFPSSECNKTFPSQNSHHEKRYVCELCGINLFTKINFKSHMSFHQLVGNQVIKKKSTNERTDSSLKKNVNFDHHVNESAGRYICEICGKVMFTVAELQSHVSSHTNSYLCPKCGACFPSNFTMKKHIFYEHGEKYKCEICDQLFRREESLKCHLETHTYEPEESAHIVRMYFCPICLKDLKSNSSKVKHMEKHKCKENICCVCMKIFDTLEILEEHRSKEHTHDEILKASKQFQKEVVFHCIECSTYLVGNSMVKTHMITVHDVRNFFKCGRCYKCFLNKDQLEQQGSPCCKKYIKFMSCDKTGTEKRCKVCFEEISDRDVISHMREFHMENKPFMCELCPKSFRQKKRFTEHKITHSNVRRFECSKCNTKFKRKNALHWHDITFHQDMYPFPCSYCERKFKRQTSFDYHVKLSHSGERPYSCHICKKAFITRIQMTSHALKHYKTC